MNTISKPHGKTTRKVLATICLLCLLLSLGAVTASAQGGSITALSCTVEKGTTASVTFNLQGNPGMYSLILKIGYDSSALTLKSVTNGSVFPDSEVVMGSLNANPFTYTGYASGVSNTTANGSIVTLNFTVNENASSDTYPVTVTQATGYDDSYNKFSIASSNGSVTVVECLHAEKEWRLSAPAKCEEAGKEILTCKKCGTTFDTRTVNATGHIHTEIRNALAATKTAEGYTGDTYCTDCGKLISKGASIAKIKVETPVTNPPATNPPATNPPATNPPATNPPVINPPVTNSTAKNPSVKTPPSTVSSVTIPSSSAPSVSNPSDTTDGTVLSEDNKPKITSGANLSFTKNTNEPLVFVSDAEFSEFVGVEIDGKALTDDDYTAESGSTVIKVSPAYLNELSAGKHTVSIISTNGSADAKFTIKNESSNDSENTETKSSTTHIIIAVVTVVIIAVGIVVFFVVRKRRNK